MAYLTLVDLARRMGPDGSIDDIGEMLAQCNEIFDDMLWREGNQPLGHTGTIRTGLPQGTWRNFYQGVAFTKSTTAQVTDTIGELVAYSRIDRSLADLEGNVAALRLSEDNAHLEGLSQQMATCFFYGNELVTQAQFTGLAPRFNTITASNAQNAVNCLSAGGSGSSNTSIWLGCWGEQTGFGFYPKGSRAGLVFEDKGDIRPGFDSNSREFEAYTSLFMWKAGLHIKNWQYFVRICNIDVTTAGHWRVRLGFLIAATFIGGTSLNIQVQGAVDASSGSYPANLSGLTWTTYAETGAIPQASLTAVAAGKANNSGLIVLEWPDRQIIANLPRFISINYNPVGTFSAGTIGTGAVFVGSLPDFDIQYYPSGFTVGS